MSETDERRIRLRRRRRDKRRANRFRVAHVVMDMEILGMLLGTATAISIIRNGFAIDLYGLPAKVLAHYIWLRDTLFMPVVWAVRYFGIEIAWWVKDTMMAYALFAAAHARAYQVMDLASFHGGTCCAAKRHVPEAKRLVWWRPLLSQAADQSSEHSKPDDRRVEAERA